MVNCKRFCGVKAKSCKGCDMIEASHLRSCFLALAMLYVVEVMERESGCADSRHIHEYRCKEHAISVEHGPQPQTGNTQLTAEPAKCVDQALASGEKWPD